MAKTNSAPELLAPRDAGRLLNLTTAGVIRLERLGHLPAVRDSLGRRLFRPADVERLVAHRASRSRPVRGGDAA